MVADKLVYKQSTDASTETVVNWYSTIITGTHFRSKEEAVSATVEKLKEAFEFKD